MANDFSGDSSVKALWRFEPGALAVDSVGGNTLVPSSSPPTSDIINYKEGSGSAFFNYALSQSYNVVDGSLDAGFPFKGGTTNQVGTFCFWIRLASDPGYQRFFYKGASGQSEIMVDTYGGYFRAVIITPGGGLQYWNISNYIVGHNYHFTVLLDGPNQTFNVIVFDETANTTITYSHSLYGVITVNTGDYYLASTYSGQFLSGNIDEFVVFNRIITSDEADAIRSGTYSVVVTRNLITACAVVSSSSAPLVTVTRPLTTAVAVASAIPDFALTIPTNDQSFWSQDYFFGDYWGTGYWGPRVPAGYEIYLTTAVAAVTVTGLPVLAVERPLTSFLNVVSAATTPSLTVRRVLALFVVIQSSTPDINLLAKIVYDLITASAVQSQFSTPILKVVRLLNSAVAGQTQAPAIVLSMLRDLMATVATGTQVPDITLKVLRNLATTISAESATSTPSLTLLWRLISSVLVTTNTSVCALTVLRNLATVIAAQTTLPDFSLGTRADYDLITAIVAQTQGPDIEMLLAFWESLLAKADRYYKPISAADLETAALQWIVIEENKEQHLSQQEYN